jgi:16S rRNA (guanine966-N2)-methyltransferase
VRIIAGAFKGRALAAVGKGDAGAHLRPTTDRVRENLFNILSGGRFDIDFDGARVLDLFAGTGALGLEALSRGATHLTCVDTGRNSLDLIRQNIAICGAKDQVKILKCDATRLPKNGDEPFNLIFLDPPYKKSMGERAIALALAGGWIADDALIIWEEGQDIVVPAELSLVDTRKYGDSRAYFLTRA